MGVNLLGGFLNETFSASQSDPNAPYTNTGGANQPGILALSTSAAGVVVTEPADAIEETSEKIGVNVLGPGEIQFEGPNAYSGNTSIVGGEVSIGNASALGSGILQFAGVTATLESTVTATLSNSLFVAPALPRRSRRRPAKL